jgi:4-hydroxy-2-oxoheptanedioate aldolase
MFGIAALGIAAVRSAFSQGPAWGQFKPQPGSVKERMHKGERIQMASASWDATRSELEEIIKKNGGNVDLFNFDIQHSPMPDERVIMRFCQLAEELGVGVRLRIQSPKMAYMTGRFADLGVQSIFVPLVEDTETAAEAVNNFYYPPLGNRSWGGELGAPFGRSKFQSGAMQATDRLKYAEWWNGTGTIGFQIETLTAAINVRKIVRPGVDWVSGGPGDMGFDIERHSNSPFKTVAEANAYVAEQLKGYDVYVPGRRG